MNRFKKILLVSSGSLALGGAAFAAIPEKYQTILDRNAFGLNPPPIVDTTAPPVTPPANIKLTGIADTFGQKKAYFMIQPKNPKETTQYINLSEGQREGVLEVVTIMKDEGEVKIRNTGVDMVLSFKENGVKAATLAPGVMPAPNIQPPGMAPQASPVYTPPASSPVVYGNPSTGMGTPPTPGAQPSTGNPPPLPGAPASSTGIRTIPTRTLRVAPSVPSPP